MYSIASWNIRGMNQTPKQNEVREVILENHLSVCAILESHVASSKLDKLCSRVFWNWNWTSNGNLCNKGSRIILGWNSDVVNIMVISQSDQVMHTQVIFKDDRLQFIWNQKPKGSHGVLKKIDRIMANLEFHDGFIGANALFQPYSISDHSPAILKIPTRSKFHPKPFKFSNLLVLNENFKSTVSCAWDMAVDGYDMFRVVKKLKALKKPLRNILKEKGNLHEKVKRLRFELDEIQRALDRDPSNIYLREEEAAYLNAFNDALIEEERFLKQRAKIEWL
ncbi:RNA-directed DNA polymerase, eukaryota, reverse transcriptase zinc-binding domain protein [Tanacetum coccineum]